MSIQHPLQAAIDAIGLQPLATALGLTYKALRKWQAAGRMPRTEWTGETNYAEQIEQLTGGKVTREQLLGPWPKWEPEHRRSVSVSGARGGATSGTPNMFEPDVDVQIGVAAPLVHDRRDGPGAGAGDVDEIALAGQGHAGGQEPGSTRPLRDVTGLVDRNAQLDGDARLGNGVVVGHGSSKALQVGTASTTAEVERAVSEHASSAGSQQRQLFPGFDLDRRVHERRERDRRAHERRNAERRSGEGGRAN